MPAADHPDRHVLGIDTGGTFTDAVLYDEVRREVVAVAKSPTTHHDLTIGIRGALDGLLGAMSRGDATTVPTAPVIELVCLSTTLATNAIVEGRGHAVAAVLIGFDDAVVERGGVSDALRGDPALVIRGGHDTHGAEREPLDLDALATALDDGWAGAAQAMAVVGHFGVRNGEHEERVARLISERRHIPVTLAHHLSAALDAPRRTVTTVLNARLIPIVDDLLYRTEQALVERGVDAPLMVVRGDGSLVSAEFVRQRPIETILSGPAASTLGAAHLVGHRSAVVVDIGGTTTDVAVLVDGVPRLDDEGATVAGHRTRVRAVAMATVGIGGDSHVIPDDGAFDATLLVGPRRVLPISVAATRSPEAVGRALAGLRNVDTPRRDALTFVLADQARLADVLSSADLTAADRTLLSRIGGAFVPVDTLARTPSDVRRLERYADRRWFELVGITPTDAAHVLGIQHTGDQDAARHALEAASRWRDRRGRQVARDAIALAEAIVDHVEHQTATVVLRSALDADGVEQSIVGDPLLRLAFDGSTEPTEARRATALRLGITLPFIGVGAPAALMHPGAARRLGAELVVPAHAEVANAVGAAVAQVRSIVTVAVTSPERGVYLVHDPGAPIRRTELEAAVAAARDGARSRALGEVERIGATDVTVDERWDERTATVEGVSVFVEGQLTVTASGRPRRGR